QRVSRVAYLREALSPRLRMRSSRFHCLTFVVLVGGAGCSSPPSGGPSDAGSGPDCPPLPVSNCQTVPSWNTQIQPIVEASCKPCHFPGGQAFVQGFALFNFSTYDTFHKAPASTIQKDLATCKMPLDGGDVPL